jgi:phosphate:Na+ symporter
VALFLAFLLPISDLLASIDPNPARAVANFHTVFNVLLALIFMLALDQLAALLIRLLPDRRQAADPSTPLYIDEPAINRATPGERSQGDTAHGQHSRGHAKKGDARTAH